jgi:phage terminase large subunit GpA-like protein
MVKGKATIQDVNWRGQILKRGVRLWYVGTDTAKDLIYGRLCVTQPGAGYVHFTKDLPPEFYGQLTAESRIPQRTARGVEYKWVNTKRARNEALDCTVYAIFCTHQLGLHTYTAAMWKKLEDAVQPANGDLFAGGAVVSDQVTPQPIQTKPTPQLSRNPARQPNRPSLSW